MSSDLGPVVITPREIYDQLVKLTGKVDGLISADRSGDHETRIRRLEQWRYALPTSMFLAAGSAVTAVVTAISKS